MNYEKKYKEALERAKNEYQAYKSFNSFRGMLVRIFPELCESEDEKVRKEIIKFLELPHRQFVGEKCQEEWIAWLEKQGNPYGQREECLDCQFNYAGECKGSCAMKRSEQKLTDKPKFHKGEWIINTLPGIKYPHLITDVRDGYYIFGEDDDHAHIASNDDVLRLWTIQDAKDGDVLKEDSCTFIIERMKSDGTAIIHCCLFDDGDFGLGSTLGFDVDSTYPATKEQRDLLFAKMKEAGYEWNAEKKELKKIHVIDEGKAEMDYCFTKMMNGEKVSSTWSEEDEKRIANILSVLSVQVCWDGATGEKMNPYQKEIDWLKSLKDRYTWRPSNEQIDTLEHFVRSIGESGYASPYDNNTKLLYLLLEQLKKLKA